MAFNYKRPQYLLLAKMLRYSTIPEVHKKRLVKDMIPYLLEDNTSFNYRWFYRMVTGEDHPKGEYYEV